jgi:hypothetical protein
VVAETKKKKYRLTDARPGYTAGDGTRLLPGDAWVGKPPPGWVKRGYLEVVG